MGLWEIKRMVDGVVFIQKWWRGLIMMRVERSEFRKKIRIAIMVQRFVRKLL